MIKVNVIEKEEKIEEKQILLEDCQDGDVVELAWQGVIGLVLGVDKLAILQQEACPPCLSRTFVEDAISGSGSGRIKRIIGTLTGIEVTAK